MKKTIVLLGLAAGIGAASAAVINADLSLSGAEQPGAQSAKKVLPAFRWARQAGSSEPDATLDWASAVVVNGLDEVLMLGDFTGTATFGPTNLTSQGSRDVVVAKLDRDGNWLRAGSFGGSGTDQSAGIALDGTGNAYIVGWFEDTANFGTLSLTSKGDGDVFIVKMAPDGSVLWARSAGGTGNDIAGNLAVDTAGNSLVVGYFSGTAMFGSNSLVSAGGTDIFLTKLDPDGNFIWALRIGGTGDDLSESVALDSSGQLYVAGCFLNTITIGTNMLVSGGSYDAFVAKADASGQWLWAAQTSGTADERALAVVPDNLGNVFLGGTFNGTGAFGTNNLTSTGGGSGFLAKLDDRGHFLWVRSLLGDNTSEQSLVQRLATDGAGGIDAVGSFPGTTDFGGGMTLTAQLIDAFAARYNSEGTPLWVVKMGGSGVDLANGIARDSSDNLYVCGIFEQTASFGNLSLTSRGGHDMFLVKLHDESSPSSTNTPPQITCSPARTIECTSRCGATNTVTVDVTDADGDPLVVIWMVDGTPYQTNLVDAAGPPTVATVPFQGHFGMGQHNVEVSVSDGKAEPTVCFTTVTVVDTTPPLIRRIVATPSVLWPANHQMVLVRLQVEAIDACACGPVSSRITAVQSSRADNARGGGQKAPDWVITGPLTVKLRAERLGTEGSRIYTIVVESKDAAGNTATRRVNITVPHDQRGQGDGK